MGLEKSNIKAIVRLHNYRFPSGKVPVSGDYAVVVLNVIEVKEGDIPDYAYEDVGTKTIVVSGGMPRLEHEMKYTLDAKLVNDKKYGWQYQCQVIQTAYDLKNPDDQRTFFSYFLTPNQIESLFSMYDNPVEKLANKDIEALTKIKGIGPVTATRLCEKYADNVNNSRAYVELKGLGITKNAINSMVKQLGSVDVVVDLIHDNPYILIRLVRGYGWEKADAIALRQGFRRDSKERCIAYAKYRLDKAADDGNSCMTIGELIEDVAGVCSPVTKEALSSYLKEEMAGQTDFNTIYEQIAAGNKVDYPLFFYSSETKKVGLFSLRLTEYKIMEELKRLKEAHSSFRYDKAVCEKIIHEVEDEQGYKYTSEQTRAIWAILNDNISILTGSAGSGKSSTVKPLIRIFEYYGLNVGQCALSGRAASLLTEYTGLTGKTIHRMLVYNPESESFQHNKKCPLHEDVIILDESSMVGEELFLLLVQAIKTGAKLVMLGDIKQLPPISVGNLLSDCMASGYIHTSTLTIIHRQALKSGIISQCLQVCEGHGLVKNDFSGEEVRGELKDFRIGCYSDAMLVHAKAIEEFKRLMSTGVSPEDIQVVVPVRARGINSCRAFNAELQMFINGDNKKKQVMVPIIDNGTQYNVIYKPGDKVMVIKNNYHAKNIYGKEVAIFNGNMGHIMDIDKDVMIVKLEEQGEILLPKEDWSSIIHGWACTAHKLQGSQSPYIIVCLDYSAYTLLMKEWLYTALTRAKKYCALIGQPRAINAACRTSNIKTKQTWLRGDLRKLFLDEVSKTDTVLERVS